MDQKEQQRQFSEELDKLIDRFRKEYEISYASVVGSLTIKIHLLCTEAEEDNDPS